MPRSNLGIHYREVIALSVFARISTKCLSLLDSAKFIAKECAVLVLRSVHFIQVQKLLT